MVCDPKCYPITWFCCHKNCPCYESPDFNGIFFTAYNVFTDFNQNLKTTNIISDSSIIRVIYPWSYYHCMAISYFSNVSQQLFSITENCTVLLHAENDTHNLPALHSTLWEIYSILKCGKGDKKCESPYRDVISWLWRLLWQSPQHISKCVVAVFLFFFLWPLAMRNVTRETETSIQHRRKCVSADFCIQICYQTQNEFLPSSN